MADQSSSQSLRARFNLSRLALSYPRITIAFWLGLAVAGILAFSSLKYALFPDVTFPVVVVNASAPTPTASDTETKLTVPIEQKLETTVGEVNSIRSSSYPQQSVITISFPVGADLTASKDKVETALKQVNLPQESTYKVIPISLNESAAVSYAIESPSRELPQLSDLAKDKIVPAIANVPGVLRVDLLGAPAPPLLKPPAPGTIPNFGTAVRFNGKDALAFQVIKRGDANTLEVVSRVEKEVDRLQQSLTDVKFVQAATQAEYIQEATHATIDSLWLAIVLAVLIIYPFLWNWRSTLITALAIPTSLLGTFIVMAIFGLNLETITLLALALVIGIIVDDAIVDVENITRHLENGESPREAAIRATDEIGLTVTAATLTIVAVFLPVAFMGGVIGQFFKPFGLTVSASVLISLLAARTLSPVLAAAWLKASPSQGTEQTPQRGWLESVYQAMLSWSLNHRWIVMGLAALSFAGGVALIPLIPQGFIPKLDRGEFNVVYTAPLEIPQLPTANANPAQGAALTPEQLANLSPEQLQAAAAAGQLSPEALQAAVEAGQLPPEALQNLGSNQLSPEQQAAIASGQVPPELQAQAAAFNPLKPAVEVASKLEKTVLAHPEVRSVFTVVGSRGQPNQGNLYVRLKQDRKLHTADVQDQLRQDLPQESGVTVSIEDIRFVDTGGDKPVQIGLLGDDNVKLNNTAKTIQERLQKLPGFVDVTATEGLDDQGNITQIERKDGQRAAYITANLDKSLPLGEATKDFMAAAKDVLPTGVALDVGGDSQRLQEVLSNFGVTIALSVLCIVAVLLLLFKSWSDPLVIAFALPMSIIGAVLGLLVTQNAFGMISLIGIIFLLGIVNKNAILLVDYINQLRGSGLSRQAAVMKAAPVRLRPILMTTASTILGMLPIALGIGAGSELRAPMAIAIIGGLTTSTLLSLIVVPVIYSLLGHSDSKPEPTPHP